MDLLVKADIAGELLELNLNACISKIQTARNPENLVGGQRKFVTVFTISTIIGTVLLLHLAPNQLPLWYTVHWLFQVRFRVKEWFRRNMHYQLTDLCHCVNFSVIPVPGRNADYS
jgi:Protein of unknown function (DUF2838)